MAYGQIVVYFQSKICEQDDFEKIWSLHGNFDVQDMKMYGKKVKGLFCDREITYKFSGCEVNSQSILKDIEIMTSCIEKLMDIDNYNAVFFNWYKDGSEYICAHRDEERGLKKESSIASISFGANRIFQIRNYKDKKNSISIVGVFS